MKILILGIYRSGTTSLQYGIAEQGYTPIFEPYNENRKHRKRYTYPMLELQDNSNIVVKCLTDQVPTPQSSVDFYTNFAKQFDNVILLSRLNREELFISFLYEQYHRLNNLDCHKKYKADLDFIYSYFSEDFINKSIEHTDIQYSIIEKVSANLSIPITYYENLYNSNNKQGLETLAGLELKLDIHKLANYLNTNKKYRITNSSLI